MKLYDLRDFCLSFPNTEEKLPFGPDTLVFYVHGKMFCLVNMDAFDYLNLKCDPEYAIELRESFEEVTPGFHMNKKHWNSVSLQGALADRQIKEWITHSYDLVVKGIPKNKRY